MKQEHFGVPDDSPISSLQAYILSAAFLHEIRSSCTLYRSWGATEDDIDLAATHGQEIALMATFNPEIRSPLGYGHAAAVNAARKSAISRCQFLKYASHCDPNPEATSDVDSSTLERREMIDKVYHFAEALPDALAKPFLAHFRHGLTPEKIAAEFDVHPTTISRRIRRATAQIRRMLAVPA